MNKKIIWAIVAVVVVVVAGGAWLLLGRNGNTPSTSSDNMNMNTSSNNNSNDTAEATNKVTIQNFAFSPAAITVKKGATVTWTNNDQVAHTVTETDGKTGPDSSALNPGQTFTFTYNSVGTFQYHCSIHTSMTGTVTVTE